MGKISESYSLRLFCVFVFYSVVSLFGVWIQATTGMRTQIWPAAGIALVATLVWGYSITPVFFISTIFVYLAYGYPLMPFLGNAIANTLEPIVALQFCSGKDSFHLSLDRVTDILKLVIVGCIISPVAATLIAVPWIWASGYYHVTPYFYMQYWAGDSLGVLLTAPLLLVFLHPSVFTAFEKKTIPRSEWLFTAPLIAAIILLFTSIQDLVRLHFFFPMVVWSALRLGQRGATLLTAAVAAFLIWQISTGSAYFGFSQERSFASPRNSPHAELYIFLYLASLQVTGLIVASVITGREMQRAEKEELMHRSQRKLQVINGELAKAVSVRDEFLSIASHELRTPMTPLKLSLQRLRRIAAETLNLEDRRDLLLRQVKMAERSLERLSHLTNELLDVTRIRAGKLFLSPGPVDLTQMIEEVLSQNKPQLERSKCKVNLQLTPGIHGVWDPLKMEEALVNLLTNAMKFGEGRPIEIHTRQLNQSAQIIVRDHGIGISPENQARLFQPFERVGSTSTNYGGLGLGLYITRKIVEAHGGNIVLTSEPGHGATFTIDIPLANKTILSSPQAPMSA